MKKILVLAIALFCIVAPQKASAQFVKAAVGANLTLPVGNLSDIAGIGFGVTGTGFYNHEGLENITLLGSIGYINMGGEDFSYYLEHVTGCYVRFGGHSGERTAYPAHSSRFDFDERALSIGAAYFHQLAMHAGKQLRDQQAVDAGG